MQPLLPAFEQISQHVRIAIEEDIGSGDLTAALISEDSQSSVQVICREHAVICGISWFNEVFRQLGGLDVIDWSVVDGEQVEPGQIICRLVGNTRVLLSGERTALNYLQVLSGTATRARHYADLVAGTGVRLLDTRKTLPGLRLQQKYAVACGVVITTG